ncbi:ETX/MTX2 family pore-forming toxin [Bacillus thuringiensis]|nr:ETX/MTX2 family pore-forming toxin [Bacillus thuringiensis]MRB61428.1 hypothetical protein [Bacillus thuringiensis]
MLSNFGSLLIKFAPKEIPYTVQTQLFGRDVDLLSDRENLITDIQPGHYTLSLPTFIRNNRRYIPINPSPSLDIMADGTTMLVIDYDDVPVSEATDTDGDGISDDLEIGGYIINNYIPGPAYNPDGTPVDPNKIIYRSDPANRSTTRDPYNDYMKTTGLNMDATVEDHAERQPLVAAHPTVKVEVVDVLVTPKLTISDKSGNKISTLQSEAIGKTITNTVTSGWNIGAKLGGKITIKPEKGKPPGEVNFEVSGGYNQSKSEATSTSNTKTTSQTEEFNWETAVTQDTVQTASIRFNLKITNVGTASIKQPRPTFNVKLGGKVIATIQFDQVPIAPDLILQPGQSSPVVSTPSTDTRETVWLTLDQLKAFELGEPIEIEVVSISGIYMTYSNGTWIDGTSWASHLAQIEEYTATIAFENKTGVVKKYRVAANRGLSTDWQPNVDIAEALTLSVGASEDENGVYIGGSAVDERWSIYISNVNNPNRYQEVLDELAQLDLTTEGILQVKLKAKDYVTVIEPSDSPVPIITYAQYSNDYKNVTVAVTVGSYPIKNVEATVRILGSIVNVPLTYNPSTGFWSSPTPFTEVADGSYAGIITAYDQQIDADGNPAPGIGEGAISQPSYFPGALTYFPTSIGEVGKNLFTSSGVSGSYAITPVSGSKLDVLSLETIGFSSNNSFFSIPNQTIFTSANDQRLIDMELKLQEWDDGTVNTVSGNYEAHNENLGSAYGDEMRKIWLERVGNYSKSVIPAKSYNLAAYACHVYQCDVIGADNSSIDSWFDINSFIAAYSGKLETRKLPNDMKIDLIVTNDKTYSVTMSGGLTNKYFDHTTTPRIPQEVYASNVWTDKITINRNGHNLPVFIKVGGESGDGDYAWYLPLYFPPGVTTIDINSKYQSVHLLSLDVYILKEGNQYVLGAKNGTNRQSPPASKMAFLSHSSNPQTSISWSMNPYKESGADLPATSSGQQVQVKRLGYFKEYNGSTTGDTQSLGSKLQVFPAKQSYPYNPGGSYSLAVQGVEHTPTAFLLEVISEGCDPYFNVKINEVTSYLGKADMRTVQDGLTYQAPNHSEIIMVPSANNSANLSIVTSNFTKGRLIVNVIGYFNESEGCFYKKLDIPISVQQNGTNALEQTLNFKPKAYILKANIQGGYTRDAYLSINGQDTIKLGISNANSEAEYETLNLGNNFTNNNYTGTGVYVPPAGSEYHLPWEIKNLWNQDKLKEKKLEIIGYFA